VEWEGGKGYGKAGKGVLAFLFCIYMFGFEGNSVVETNRLLYGCNMRRVECLSKEDSMAHNGGRVN
jgi:hypothetical protein